MNYIIIEGTFDGQRILQDIQMVASKYINGYAAFFSLAWKLRKQGVEDLIKKVRDMILDFRLFLSLRNLKEYRLFMPDDIEWRPASWKVTNS